MSLWRHLRAIALLPGMVAVVIPALIVWGDEPTGDALPFVTGALLIAAGFAAWLWTVTLLAKIGKGTLAPWDPTQNLVEEGPYRYVRNPMITAVCAVLAGEALIFESMPIALFLAGFVVVNHVFFLVYEEPALERRFGDEYRDYKSRVPRWLPRLSARGRRVAA